MLARRSVAMPTVYRWFAKLGNAMSCLLLRIASGAVCEVSSSTYLGASTRAIGLCVRHSRMACFDVSRARRTDATRALSASGVGIANMVSAALTERVARMKRPVDLDSQVAVMDALRALVALMANVAPKKIMSALPLQSVARDRHATEDVEKHVGRGLVNTPPQAL